MKYAVLGPQLGINRISDTKPQNMPEGTTVVQISNEKAATVEAGRTATPPVRYFLIDGQLKTMEEQREIQRAARLLEREAAMTPADKIKLAEAHVLKHFTPLGVSALQDKLLTAKEAGTLETMPKLIAVYTWLKTVQGMAVAGQIAFPEPPYTFDEVLAE